MPTAPKPAAAVPAPTPDAGGDPVARYETAVAELETLVTRLEGGDAPLDEALSLFERGMALVNQCRAALDHAELRVKNLLDAAPAPTGSDDGGDEDADDAPARR